jgi:hypothetical protein
MTTREEILLKISNLEKELSAEKSQADGGKIQINGSFGKFGNRWSTLYSPQLLIQVTITGQLALLMLIERLHEARIPVVSANTDGVVIKCPKSLQLRMGDVVAGWEIDTGFETEATQYSALYSRDVNNYVAVKHDGTAKTKGAYADPGLSKNPTNQICVDAVIAKITKGESISKTIRECTDIRKFVTIRAVRGGAIWDGFYLGKAVRWYYSKTSNSAIHYKMPNKTGNHNKVARTDGCRPLMNLPDALPSDVDFAWYIREARSILEDIGYNGGL